MSRQKNLLFHHSRAGTQWKKRGRVVDYFQHKGKHFCVKKSKMAKKAQGSIKLLLEAEQAASDKIREAKTRMEKQ